MYKYEMSIDFTQGLKRLNCISCKPSDFPIPEVIEFPSSLPDAVMAGRVELSTAGLSKDGCVITEEAFAVKLSNSLT